MMKSFNLIKYVLITEKGGKMKKFLKFLVVSSVLTAIIGITNPADALSIRNISDYTYRSMSVSSWASGGAYGIFDTKPGSWEKWDRSASRGVLLINHNTNKTYYLASNLSGYFQDDNVLRNSAGRTIHPISTDVPSGDSRKILVENVSGGNLKVSISKWTNSNDGSFYTIKNGSTEQWGRDDYRGYIMVIEDGYTASYYIKPGVHVVINSQGPFINNEPVQRITLQE